MVVTVNLFDVLALAFVVCYIGLVLWGARK